MNAITLLKNDHKTVNDLFRRFERSGDHAYKTRREIVDRIVEELSVHAAIEEVAFYPAVRAEVHIAGLICRATSATSETFGVSLTTSGLAVSGRTRASSRSSSRASAPMINPVSTFGQETFSSSAAELAEKYKSAHMPDLGVTNDDASDLIAYLKGETARTQATQNVAERHDEPRN